MDRWPFGRFSTLLHKTHRNVHPRHNAYGHGFASPRKTPCGIMPRKDGTQLKEAMQPVKIGRPGKKPRRPYEANYVAGST